MTLFLLCGMKIVAVFLFGGRTFHRQHRKVDYASEHNISEKQLAALKSKLDGVNTKLQHVEVKFDTISEYLRKILFRLFFIFFFCCIVFVAYKDFWK